MRESNAEAGPMRCVGSQVKMAASEQRAFFDPHASLCRHGASGAVAPNRADRDSAADDEIAKYRRAALELCYGMRDTPSASMRGLARRLLAVEAMSQSAAGSHVHEGVRVCEKLQISVTRFAGSDGFAALLRRALALARAEVPSLQTVKLKPDGSLEGCEAFAAADGGSEVLLAIIAHLLGLLETFVGEPFTLRLVHEAWPDLSLDS